MKKRSFFTGILIVFFAALTWWNWRQLRIDPLERKTLRLSLDNLVESLDPARSYSDDSLTVSSQVLEPLYQYHYLKRPYEIQPLLAEAIPQVEQNGTLVTINIKHGIFYHSHPSFKAPRELIAEDFVMQFKRLATDLKSPGRSLFSGLVVGFDDYYKETSGDWTKIRTRPLKGVEASDSHTLILHLTKAEPNLIYYLAMNFIVPIPWELIEVQKNDLNEVLVGTGPYEYRGYNGKCFQMQKFKHYREEYYPTSGDRYANVQKLLTSSKERIPFIETVQFYVAPEEDRWKKFLAHELDLLTVPKTFITKLYDQDGELAPELKRLDVKLRHFPSLANRWYSFNMRDPILGKNKNLRMAIAYGIDYTKYIQLLSQNTNLRANSLLVPGISGYMPAEEFRFKYDPGLAKEYLKMAGIKDPSELPEIIYSTRGTQPIHLLEAKFIKEQLEALGFKVKIEVLEFSEFLKKGRAGELQFFTDNWFFDYPDAENILQLLITSNSPGINKSGYSNPDVDKLYLELKETYQQEAREKIFKQIENIVFDDLPWIPMMYESTFVLQHPEIKNFRKSSVIRNFVKYLKIEN
jgi:oligopeptide transport system substrate-binding protein